MTEAVPTPWTIAVDDKIYELLERTASDHDTDFNGALHHLLKLRAAPPIESEEDGD